MTVILLYFVICVNVITHVLYLTVSCVACEPVTYNADTTHLNGYVMSIQNILEC